VKSPIRLEELPFATTLSVFGAESGESSGLGGLLEIDGYYDRVRFDGVVFAAADGSEARFIESAFVGGSFDEGRLRRARFTDVWFEQTRLVAVDVAEASLTDVWFNGCVFAGVPAFTSGLRRVVFRGCKLDSVNFREAKLTDVTFDDCVLRDVDFAGARLQRLRFPGCTLSGLDFSRATCKDVDLRSARLGERPGESGGSGDAGDAGDAGGSGGSAGSGGSGGSGRGIKSGFDSLAGVRIDSVQLMTLAPQLAHHLGIAVSDD
jgi:hypothetical protein